MKNRFTPLHRALLAAALVTAANFSAQAQSVGVGTTAPDASAALDVVSSAKGVLLPRLTSAQRTGMTAPATGLIVFQTDGTPGFYYNSGTTTAPVWQQIATAAGTSTGFIQNQNAADQAANFRISGNGSLLGNLGVGTSTPTEKLVVSTSVGSMPNTTNFASVETVVNPFINSTQGINIIKNDGQVRGFKLYQTGSDDDNSSFRIASTNVGLESDAITIKRNTGNVGIGTTAPTEKFDVVGNIQSSANIAVDYGNANAGTVANTLRFGPTNSGEGIGSKRTADGNRFGLDFYTTSTNRMSITSGGNVGIGTTAPLAGLHVDTPESSNTTALGIIASGGTTGNPSIELRGSGKSPYIDFAETSGANFTTRLISSSGTLNVNNANAAVPALNVNGYTKLSGATAGPAIAMVKLVGTIPGGPNSQNFIDLPAGIIQGKVLSLTGMTITGGNLYPPNNGINNAGTTSYQLYLNTGRVIINTDTNSSGVYNQTVNVLITYEQ